MTRVGGACLKIPKVFLPTQIEFLPSLERSGVAIAVDLVFYGRSFYFLCEFDFACVFRACKIKSRLCNLIRVVSV